MPVMIGGTSYDPNIPSQQQALFDLGYMYYQGLWIKTEQIPGYIAPAALPAGPPSGNVYFGTGNVEPAPGIMPNVVVSSSFLGGAWSGFDVSDIAGGLATLRSFALEQYGSDDLGAVRYSSEVLENEPTGIRPGIMERIVIPAWARRERGSPL